MTHKLKTPLKKGWTRMVVSGVDYREGGAWLEEPLLGKYVCDTEEVKLPHTLTKDGDWKWETVSFIDFENKSDAMRWKLANA